MSTNSQSPRAKRSSTEKPVTNKGGGSLGQSNRTPPEYRGIQWDTEKVNAPYEDGGGKYSRPRRKS